MKDIVQTFVGVFYSFTTFRLGVFIADRYLRRNLKEDRKPGETEEDVVQRLGNHIGGIFFYSTTFCIFFFHYRNTEFCPRIFGGPLDLSLYPLDIPQRLDSIGSFAYLLQLGHRIFRTFKHMRYYSKARIYWQILVHHWLAVFLVYLSFVFGVQYYGLTLLLFYDLTELFAYFTQINRELKKTRLVNITALIYVLGWIVTWAVYRVYGAINEVVLAGFKTRNQPIFRENQTISYSILGAVFILCLLNLFWIYQLSKIAVMRLRGHNEFQWENQFVEKTGKKVK